MYFGLEQEDHDEGCDEKSEHFKGAGSKRAGSPSESGPAVEADCSQEEEAQPDEDAGSREVELINLKLHQKGLPDLLFDSA